MNRGDYVKVTMFRGVELDEPLWMRVVSPVGKHKGTSYDNWWSGFALCGPPINLAIYIHTEPVGMSSDNKPDRWEVIGSEPPDEFYAAQAKFTLLNGFTK